MTKAFRRDGRLRRHLALACLLALPGTAGAAWAQQGPGATAPPPAAGTSPAPPPAQPPSAPAAANSASASLPAPGGASAPVVTIESDQLKGYEAAALPVEGKTIVLTLEKAIEVGLRHNNDIVVSRYNRVEARLNILAALGYYDLLLGADVKYQAISSPGLTLVGTTVIPGTSGKDSTANFSVSQQLPSGADVQAFFTNFRSSTPGQPFDYNSGINFAITQPLLRGFGSYVTENPILVAQTNSSISRAVFNVQVITSTQQIVNAYWSLVNARESLVVAQESLQLAKDLNERNRIQVEVGTLAPLELVNSQAAIATREEQILTAQEAIGDAEDQLRLLLNIPPGNLWTLEIRPTTPAETDRVTVNLEEAIQLAFANRPELVTSALNVNLAKINAALARNQELPALNFVGGYGYSGANVTYAAALRQVTGLDFRSWNAELQFGFPIPNRQARARSAIAKLEVEKNNSSYEYEKNFITNEVRTATRRVLTAAQQIDASHAARGYQEKNLDAERKRYENGMSTSFQITQIQDQLTQAKQAEVNAITGYRTALAEYYRTIGRLLDVEGITLVDPADKLRRFTFHVGTLP